MASRADYEAFFREADSDNSGTLTLQELISLLKRKGYKQSESELQGFFAQVDTSGDGLISFDEYMVAMGQQPPKSHGLAAMRRLFLDFDKDKNGRIDKCELKKVFQECGKYFSDKELDTMMKQFDDDGSGDMDYEEFLRNIFGVNL